MAIYYLGMKTFSRAAGKSGSRATSAAAYRSGERIRDERTGHVYDHRRRADVLHKEIVLPAQLAARRGPSLAWARDRSSLWNAAEHAESRRNARVAREFVVALPHELTPRARTRLAHEFAQEIADRYRSAVDVAIHAPRGDARNFHAHLLSTTREVTPDGLGRKTALELSGTERHRLGLPRWREEIASLRERWADRTNFALEREHVAARVSHLSRAERGLEPAGRPRLPLAAYHMERRGQRSFVAERIRERYRAGLERARAASAEARTVSEPPALRRLGAGIAGAWRMFQERLGIRTGKAEQTASQTVSAEPRFGSDARERSAARQETAPTRDLAPTLQHARARELVRPPDLMRAQELPPARQQSTQDDLARESALRWRAIRDDMRARGLTEWPGTDRTPERTKERQHANDHGFGL